MLTESRNEHDHDHYSTVYFIHFLIHYEQSIMMFPLYLLPLGLFSIQAAFALPYQQPEYTPHSILHHPGINFENLAIRSNGQILTTSSAPNASVYQVDPSGVLPMTLIHLIANDSKAAGIIEGKPDIFYVASGFSNLSNPLATVPSSYAITEIDVRGVSVLSNGTLSKQPITKRVASLPEAALLNGVAMARPHSDHLLVADSFRGLIWSVNVKTGAVDVALNDTTTKGSSLAPTSPAFTGVNGLKVYNDTMWWTSTGASKLYKVPIDETGKPKAGHTPTLVASNVSCDDFAVDVLGNAYVASPYAVLTKVTASGQATIIAGTFNSTSSDLGGPTAVRFGRLPADRELKSIYVTLNGGLLVKIPDSAGIVRIDLK